MAEAAEHDGMEDLGDREEERRRNRPQACPERVGDTHHAETVASLEPAPVVDGSALPESLEVADPRRRCDHHPCTCHAGPPAEIEVIAVERDAGVEAAQRCEEVGTDQGGRSGDVEGVPDGVVLGLVEIAPLDERGRLAVAVRTHANLQEPLGAVPVDDLGPHHAGIGPVGLLDHDLDGVAGEAHVVVAQQQERRPLHRIESLIGSCAESAVGLEPSEVSPR